MIFSKVYDIFNTGCESMKNKQRIFSFLDVTAIIIISSVIMCLLGGILVYKHLGGVNYSLLESDQGLHEFISAYDNLVENYYDDLDRTSLIDAAISGMYSVIDDPYTTYLDTEDSSYLNETLKGEYEGIGIQIRSSEEEGTIIDEVFVDSPAEKCGLKEGDVIIKVNGNPVAGKNGTEIAEMIKGTKSKSVELTILRDGIEQTFKPSIGKLFVPAVSSQVINHAGQNIGFIKLTVFSDTADTQFSNSLSKLEGQNISSLIVDLRDNTGGYLQVAKNIAEMFLAKGDVIYSLENKNSKETYKDETSEKRNYKITVLINKSSASASEILAAALRDSYGATLVGETSYGKGKVQEKSNLTDGTTIKYTTARWLTPSGECIDGIGLAPNHVVVLDTSIYNADDLMTDSQVLKALENLVG